MQTRFLEVTALVKQGLRMRLEQREEELVEDEGIMTSVYNWFVARPEEPMEQETVNTAVISDKKFLSKLQRELKLFEMCTRIFEEQCVQTLISLHKEVQSQNIDSMVHQERQSRLSARNQALSPCEIKPVKYVTNQLLDKDGQLLTEH